MKTGLLEIRPLSICKERRTRRHFFYCLLAFKPQPELERSLATAFGTTAQDPNPLTVSDALAGPGSLHLLTFNTGEKTVALRLPKPDLEQWNIPDALKVSWPTK